MSCHCPEAIYEPTYAAKLRHCMLGNWWSWDGVGMTEGLYSNNVPETAKPKYDQFSSRNSITGNISKSCYTGVDPEWGKILMIDDSNDPSSWNRGRSIYAFVELLSVRFLHDWAATSLIQLFNIAFRSSSRYLVGSNSSCFSGFHVKPMCRAKKIMLDFERRGYINYIEDRQLEILLAISELSPKNIIENSQTPKSYPKQTRQQTTQKRSQLSDFENRRILPQIKFDSLTIFPESRHGLSIRGASAPTNGSRS